MRWSKFTRPFNIRMGLVSTSPLFLDQRNSIQLLQQHGNISNSLRAQVMFSYSRPHSFSECFAIASLGRSRVPPVAQGVRAHHQGRIFNPNQGIKWRCGWLVSLWKYNFPVRKSITLCRKISPFPLNLGY